MLRVCAATAITGMGESKSLGDVLMTNYMQPACVRTVTSTTIIVREGKKTRR